MTVSRLVHVWRLLTGHRAEGRRGGKGPLPDLEPEADPYLRAYREQTDVRVAADPQAAVGGLWEELGRLQLDFLVAEGLEPCHRLLDIGCGTLRGGRLFIAYLERGRYTGIDVSAGAIRHARDLLVREGLADKSPLLVRTGGRLDFAGVEGWCFDYLLAQSVFTHLPPSLIGECLANVGRVMAEGGRFYFTYHVAEAPIRTGFKDYRYPAAFFVERAAENGFELVDCSARYAHPRGQRMVRLTRRPAG